MSNFCTVRFVKTESEPNFGFSHIPRWKSALYFKMAKQATYQTVDNTHPSQSDIWIYKILHLHPQAAIVAVTFLNPLDCETMRFFGCNQTCNSTSLLAVSSRWVGFLPAKTLFLANVRFKPLNRSNVAKPKISISQNGTKYSYSLQQLFIIENEQINHHQSSFPTKKLHLLN